ncbi:glycosyltransferase, partial [bacterium]
MRIVLVAPAVNTGAERGFYNRQEVGLARGLAQLGHEAIVLKVVPRGRNPESEDLGDNCQIIDVPARTIGSHGFVDLRRLESMRPDAVVLFADLQLCVPGVGRWCRQRGLPFVEVVGTIDSNREGRAMLARWTRWRNLREFRRSQVVAKTPAVAETLAGNGVSATIVPVGLDITVLPRADTELRQKARNSWGALPKEPILGFVGNLAPYKAPLGLVPILLELRKEAPWKLVMVGDGPLAGEFDSAIESAGLSDWVTRKSRMPNEEMWQLYEAADVLVNLNPGEIFGMAIVESMFYGTPVVAVEAPGPRFILRDGFDGRI